ncbi:hypothetical protein [Nostoc sphaeroides]|nr:hypothetical protein [Nostoc sphaeroides]
MNKGVVDERSLPVDVEQSLSSVRELRRHQLPTFCNWCILP